MNVAEEGIKAVNDLAGLIDEVAGDLEDIEPPAELSSAHADYVASLKDMALGIGHFAEAVKGGSISDAIAASEAISAAVEKVGEWRAPASLARIEAASAPIPVGHGRVVYGPSDELLDAIREGYREAAGLPGTYPAAV